MKNSDFTYQVYELVKKIPKGQVITYGQIARQLGKPHAARAVGNILHHNYDANVPCHRVVNQEGKVATRFAFGGAEEQKKRLLLEGVRFKDKISVDIKNS